MKRLFDWIDRIGGVNILIVSFVTLFVTVCCFLFYVYFNGTSFLELLSDINPVLIIPLSALITVLAMAILYIGEIMLFQIIIFFVIFPLCIFAPLLKPFIQLFSNHKNK